MRDKTAHGWATRRFVGGPPAAQLISNCTCDKSLVCCPSGDVKLPFGAFSAYVTPI